MATKNSRTPTARVFDFQAPLPATLYWDASFIVNSAYEDAHYHAECVSFAARLSQSGTLSFVSTLALDESWFNLLQLMIEDDYGEKMFWRLIHNDPKVIERYLNFLERVTQDIYDDPHVRILSLGKRAPLAALKNMRAYSLLPRDALHLAAMRQAKVKHIVTTDADFLPVKGITIYTCNPALLK